jgi:hypothetical protein
MSGQAIVASSERRDLAVPRRWTQLPASRTNVADSGRRL